MSQLNEFNIKSIIKFSIPKESVIVQEKLQNSLLDVGEYLSLGWSEFAKNLQTFLIFTLLINLPIALVGLFLASSEEPSNVSNASVGIIILFVLISVVLGMLAVLAVPQVIERSIRGQTLDATIALQNAVPKLFIALVVGIIASILVGVGLILLLIPGIWLGTLLSFTYYAIAVRNCGFNALDYSRSLIKGRWWAVFGRNLLLGLCFVLLFILLALAIGIISSIISLAGLAIVGIVVQLVSSLIFSLISYYSGAVYTVMFLNFDYTRNPPSEI